MKTRTQTKQTTNLPRLPEPSFAPLPAGALDAMIAKAIVMPQQARGAEIIAFRRPAVMWGGMAALAATVMLAVVLSPHTSVTTAAVGITPQADFSDMLVLESMDS